MSESKLDEALAKGRQLIRQRAWAEAIEAFDEAIAVGQSCSDAWSEKGKLLHRLGRVEEALETFERVISMNPENNDGWYNNGMCLTKLGRNEESLEAFQEARRLNPESSDASQLEGINFLGILGGDREALEALEKVAVLGNTHAYVNQQYQYRVDLEFIWDDGVVERMWVKEETPQSIIINSPRYAQCSLTIEARDRISCNYPAKELAGDLAVELASKEDEIRFFVFPKGQVPAYSVRTPPKYAKEVWCDIVVTDHFAYHLKRTIGFDKVIGRQFAGKVIANFEPF
jgi:tetratricopeptide (TPR) repeat protein